MESDEKNMLVVVRIYGDSGSNSYRVLVPRKNVSGEKHCRGVVGAGVEMACALLDAPYQKETNP